MLETLMGYVNLYTTLATVVILLGLGYALNRWYMISPYRYGSWVIIIALFLAIGYAAVVWYKFSPYTVAGLYLLVVIAYLASCYYHISWKDLMGRFYRPTTKPT